MKGKEKGRRRAAGRFHRAWPFPAVGDVLTSEERREMAAAEIDRVLKRLPEPLRCQAEAVVLRLEDYPGPEILEEGFSQDLLGFFHGYAHHEEAGYAAVPQPPQISLFLENIWSYAWYRPRLFCREVRITYLHELGHFLGLAEDDLERRGLA